ncbi:DNA-binding response regulator [Psychromonas sp. psych-6C06]|uniref:response regulator n=1 Tax=Psychromonas sp. psych-6C06 TaxID=2058089 RepID=UPI000C330564|nr:response regulator [Psychromonas sp. psych-6C06]PKF61476.1 DNA-binding response regulator [Psychromonas sp. psych-6C06]
MHQPHLLIVDDHREIRELLQRFFVQHNYRVTVAKDGKEMKQRLKGAQIDLIVLDLMLPGEDGLTLCRDLRSSSNIPIVMLTAMGDEMDKIIGLEMGADDYLAKPFNPRELLARIKAVLRRVNTLKSPTSQVDAYHFAQWTIDIHKRELTDQAGVMVTLSSAEFDLLRVFLEHPQRVLSRDQLLELSKGRDGGVYDRAIDTLISRLRKKLEIDAKHPELIKTIWGGGYQFTCEVNHDQ